MERRIYDGLKALNSFDIPFVQEEAVARLVLAPCEYACAAMLAAALEYGPRSDALKGLAAESFALLSNEAEAHGRDEEAYGWGQMVERTGAVVDAWRGVLREDGSASRHDIPQAEAALLLRRHRR